MRPGNELYCRECGFENRTEEREYECPKCGSRNVFNSNFIICCCGATVFVNGFTNECPECGRLYNGFGQELAPVEEWDDEDRYECFGPQNEPDW